MKHIANVRAGGKNLASPFASHTDDGRWDADLSGRCVNAKPVKIRSSAKTEYRMKNRLNIALAAVLAIAGTLVWVAMRNRTPMTPIAAGTDTIVVPVLRIPVGQLPPPAVLTETPAAPTIHIPPAFAAKDQSLGEMYYTARKDDTISSLAVEFFGSDTHTNETAIIDRNPSLRQNPDLILTGQTYLIPARVIVAVQSTVPDSQSAEPAATQPTAAADAHQLRYSARPGDTVSVLASALLGSDSSRNRNTIINANSSLVENPDRVLAGKTYQIPVQSDQPLAAAPAVNDDAAVSPTTQPDADQLVVAGSTRDLRYTAKAGDNVSTLAAALLGSDTKENRDAIVNSNPSLKLDPDRVLAGQTYWIPAPTALRQ
jgi:nucleoid-associated protein YgaU